MRHTLISALACAAMSAGAAHGAILSGNPASDGWFLSGNSMQNGIYVQSGGSANYGYDIYTNYFSVSDSSAFDISGHGGAAYDQYYREVPTSNIWDPSMARSWSVGDTVVAVGGVFNAISASDAGWGSFGGDPVNDNLGTFADPLRYQAKFGNSDATWSTSTVAPNSGNGSGSTSNGGTGAALVRSTAWLNLGDGGPIGAMHSGEIMGVQESAHVIGVGVSYSPDVARLIWDWNPAGYANSWQILINTSLMEMDAGGVGMVPGLGDMIVTTVQRAGSPNTGLTDGLVYVVPTPGALALFGLAGLAGARRRRA